MNEQLALKLFM